MIYWSIQWIGLGENLQENPIFNGKNPWFLPLNFPVKTNPMNTSIGIHTINRDIGYPWIHTWSIFTGKLRILKIKVSKIGHEHGNGFGGKRWSTMIFWGVPFSDQRHNKSSRKAKGWQWWHRALFHVSLKGWVAPNRHTILGWIFRHVFFFVPSGYDIHSLPWKENPHFIARWSIYFDEWAIDKPWRTVSHNQVGYWSLGASDSHNFYWWIWLSDF